MTIGEKITNLRISAGMTQEELAEKLSVSRQSVSKWEMDQSVPQLDKVILLCDLFCIGADDLLREDMVVHRDAPDVVPKEDGSHVNKYFGTDGFRGEVNTVLTAEHAFRIGRFLGWYFSSSLSGCRKPNYRPRIVVGKDTRRSSYMLEYALVAGITASGADAYMLHVTTTPGVSYITRVEQFDCGIMITASHNPFYDNGIKIINRYGEKPDDAETALIEAYIDGNLAALGLSDVTDLPLAKKEKLGCIIDYVAGRNRYVGYLISIAAHSYKDLRIGLDCANGSSWMIAKSVFDALGAQTYVIGASPDGTNVNLGCGSTHIENLCAYVKENRLDIGFAFDGDADRCIAVDENGEVVDGDKIIYVLACRLRAKGILDHDTVVTTVMSNSGLSKALRAVGIQNEQTKVGDRFVYERMQQGGFRLGGEQSGHIILRKYATTGDGILTAMILTEEMRDTKSTLSKLAAPVTLLPQKTKSVKVTSKAAVVGDPEVTNELDAVNRELADNGRALLRQSGTEPVIRVMLECETEELCNRYIDRICAIIKKRGYFCD